MELALNEVKTQAKKLLKAIRLNSDLKLTLARPLKKLALTSLEELKLKHCLTLVAHQLGFDNWHHAQDVLSGSRTPVDTLDMGTLFYPKGADGFINEWFADYQQAKDTQINQDKLKWLLPYKKQFIVVKQEYILAFKFDKKLMLLWADIDHDMVDGYKSVAWDKLTCAIIKNRPRAY